MTAFLRCVLVAALLVPGGLFSSARAMAQTPLVSAPPPKDVTRIGLQEAVRRALSYNPNVSASLVQVKRADALVRQARSGFLPTVVANVTYTRLDSDRVLNGVVYAAANQGNVTGVLTIPIVAAQPWTQEWHAKDNADVSRAQVVDVKRQIATAVMRAYVAVVSQHRVIDVTLRSRDNARAHFDYTKARRVGGFGNRIDEARAEQEVATAEAQLQTAYANLVRAREAMGVLCNTEGPLDADGSPDLGGVPSLDEGLHGARTARSDIKVLRLRLGASQRMRRDVLAYYAPSLTAIFAPFIQQPPQITLPAAGWQLQLVLSVPIFDGGLRYGVKDERTALVQEAEVNLAGGLRQSEADVRTAFEAVDRSLHALAAAKEAARLAADTLSLATLGYRAGASTNIEVIDAERRARDADTAMVVAEDSLLQARLDLLVASGRLP